MERKYTQEIPKQMRTVLRALTYTQFYPIPRSRRYKTGQVVKGDDYYSIPGIELDRKITSTEAGYRGKLLIGWKDGSVCQLEVYGRYEGDIVEESRMGKACEPGLWDFTRAYNRLAEMALPQAA